MTHALVEGSAQVIVVYRLDRVFVIPDVLEALRTKDTLEGLGVAVHSVTESLETGSPEGEFQFSMWAARREYEYALIQESGQILEMPCHRWEILSDMKPLKNGRFHAPYGWKKVCCPGRKWYLIRCKAEEETLERVLGLVGQGVSEKEIATTLNREGRKPRTDVGAGGQWAESSIRRILTQRT